MTECVGPTSYRYCEAVDDCLQWTEPLPCGDGAACVDDKCDCAGSCDGKECGDDGCGNSCGDCDDLMVCKDHQCKCSECAGGDWQCIASMSYHECTAGPGECGSWSEPQTCAEGTQCNDDLQACTALPPAQGATCEHGTRLYVERSVDQALRDPALASLLDRSCRAGRVPDFALPTLEPEPSLVAAADRALARLCEQGLDAPRPWNPIFQPRRPR